VRYAWDQFDEYFVDRAFARALATPAAAALRTWDRATVNRVDHFIANSNTVRERIQQNYGRDSTVIFPPVNVARFSRRRAPSDFYLLVGALVPYKRVDRAIAACTQANRRLVVVGDGPDRKRLQAQAPAHVDFRGHVSDEVLAQLYSECRALIMPGVEDFGISAVEAQAAGAPVIALASGGALDTVSHETGVLVANATADAFADAICKLESSHFEESTARHHAAGFGIDKFRSGLRATVQTMLA
jgi:glycosyltransferase involved in cell wall biosynthesis